MTMNVAVAGAGLHRFIWRAWPWMNWLVPVAFVASPIVTRSGGWASLTLLVSAPVLIPAAGLLGSPLSQSFIRCRCPPLR